MTRIARMTPLKKLRDKDTVRHIWGCVLGTHPHICRTALSSLAFFSGLTNIEGDFQKTFVSLVSFAVIRDL